MGQQQLLLVILGVIIVGIAIAVGFAMFSSSSVSSNRDAIVNDLLNLAADAYQFRSRPVTMGGGSNSYANFQIPAIFRPNENATYSTSSITVTSITFVANSALGFGTVSVICDSLGHLGNFTYTGEFL